MRRSSPSTSLRNTRRPPSTRAGNGSYRPSTSLSPRSGGSKNSSRGSNIQYSGMPSSAYVARFGPSSSLQVPSEATSSTKSGAFGSSHSL